MTREEEILQRTTVELGEHFDSVRIFVTGSEGRESASGTDGTGNFYAQLGQVREWLLMQDERARDKVRCEG